MTATPAGIAWLDRIAQVKLPVTNLARSVTWYRRASTCACGPSLSRTACCAAPG